MSLFLARPQDFSNIRLNIGDEYGRPQNIFEETISPGVDSEVVEETLGVFDALIFDDGTETGFVLVEDP